MPTGGTYERGSLVYHKGKQTRPIVGLVTQTPLDGSSYGYSVAWWRDGEFWADYTRQDLENNDVHLIGHISNYNRDQFETLMVVHYE